MSAAPTTRKGVNGGCFCKPGHQSPEIAFYCPETAEGIPQIDYPPEGRGAGFCHRLPAFKTHLPCRFHSPLYGSRPYPVGLPCWIRWGGSNANHLWSPMPDLVQFKPSTDDKEALQAIIDTAQGMLDAGTLKDLAILMATHDENGPGWNLAYYGERATGNLLAASTHLQFDIHHRAYEDVE